MRRRTMSRLGETEMEVLRHVWALGEASVADVYSTILKDRAIAYTTVMTVMRKLTRKGFLHCDSTGSRYLYTPARAPAKVREELVQDLLDQVFQGSASALVQTLVRSERIPPGERAEIQKLLMSLAEEGESDV
ncbi:MAG: BlaI/MecI/CopY family transcriptional regulator [Gemmatimonadetes bacterium]|nr:BlaI/MecI/CopY family transcriptional regulator [Gemmatimonadota bacterium]MXX71311.1 BlaI/MecI/CopY family transcriptional regulator [Gemmatimonadota bacterium]MYC90780.1 BlaI/MecI/CopY family transcriptional regulator [Gemmatimonadota bacterium]MYG34933.1 BlaI/MecI/CopY family transcriptional regulator [Gemmatimonadota bacterium]MYJ17819.1 BlaI/MecI/CopY family transcriptional regulator [Gemmatimonadota bacterium]